MHRRIESALQLGSRNQHRENARWKSRRDCQRTLQNLLERELSGPRRRRGGNRCAHTDGNRGSTGRRFGAGSAAPALGRARISGMLAPTAAVAAVLSSLLTVALQGNDGPVYEQASGDSGEIVLTVSFQPEATEGAISALLREKGLVIVDGPSALGLYRLAVPFDTPLDEAAAYLGEATEIIAMVESTE